MKHSHPTLRQKETVVVPDTPRPVSVFVPQSLEIASQEPAASVEEAVEKAREKAEKETEIILVNYNTKELTLNCYKSFREFYENVNFTLIDNNSTDGSRGKIVDLESNHTKIFANNKNISHGPALHQGILQSTKRYVFTLDSDCIIKRGGFLEEMVAILEMSIYATGWLRWVNYNGVAVDKKAEAKRSIAELEANFTPYIHPYAMLLNREVYLKLPPFSRRGAPCVDNMRAAKKAGLKVASFPVEDYVEHLVAGTRRMYSGAWNPKDSTEKQEWKKDKTFPI